MARAESVSTSIRLTWWGHATVLIQDRARILTDPLLTGALMHLHRRAGLVPAPAARTSTPSLISHLHMDHLHLPSLKLLEPGTPVLIPRGAAGLLDGLRLEPVEVSAGDVVPVGDATVHVVHAVHDATRWPWGGPRGDAVGYVVQGAGATYFAGDTSVFDGMGDLYPDRLRRGAAAGVGLGSEPARRAHGPRAGRRLPADARRRRRRARSTTGPSGRAAWAGCASGCSTSPAASSPSTPTRGALGRRPGPRGRRPRPRCCCRGRERFTRAPALS